MVKFKEIPVKIKEIPTKVKTTLDKLSPGEKIVAGAAGFTLFIGGVAAGGVIYGGGQEQRPPGVTSGQGTGTPKPSEASGMPTPSESSSTSATSEPSSTPPFTPEQTPSAYPTIPSSPTPSASATESATPAETDVDREIAKTTDFVQFATGFILKEYDDPKNKLDFTYGEDHEYKDSSLEWRQIRLNPSRNPQEFRMYVLETTVTLDGDNKPDVTTSTRLHISKQVGPWIGNTPTIIGYTLEKEGDGWSLKVDEPEKRRIVPIKKYEIRPGASAEDLLKFQDKLKDMMDLERLAEARGGNGEPF